MVQSMLLFLFNQFESETGVVNQMIRLCFRKRSIIGQLHAQTPTAEKEKLYNLSTKIICIKF